MRWTVQLHMKGVKEKGSHKWTRFEDDTMLQHLHEMSVDRYWKPEGVFKAGWTTELLRRMKENWTDCPIEVKHIENRHKYLKEKYYAISEMLKQTGISGSICSWNQESCLIECDKQWYIDWVKTHKKACGLYGTPFPYYDTLDRIYSRDRATGNVVETLKDSTSESLPPVESNPDGVDSLRGNKRKVDTDDTPPARRRRRGDSSDALYDSFASCFENSMGELNTHIATIATAMDREQSRVEEDRARDDETEKKIMEDLKMVIGLSFREVTSAARILIGDKVQYAVYEQVLDEQKLEFVKMMLKDFGHDFTT